MPYSITFIQEPRFVVHLGVDHSIQIKEKNWDELIQEIAAGCFRLISCFYRSIASTNDAIIRHGWKSFKVIALGWTGMPSSSRIPLKIHLLVYRLCLWSFSITTVYLNDLWKNFWDEFQESEKRMRKEDLFHYENLGLNFEHFAMSKIELEDQNVPEEITVKTLLEIYDTINFTKPDKPGYMTESCRKEYSKTYSVVELRQGLKNFVKKVVDCEAFLGTPPAHDFLQLNTFYEQIQKAVRLSIQESNQRLKAFFAKAGRDQSKYSEEQRKLYQNHLEDRARIAIDLAIAGHHCGARFMGEAMSVYGSFFSAAYAGNESSLKEHLYEMLAKIRKEIAESDIQKYLGTDTHSYAAYMHQLGATLGIPGTKGVVEYLKKSFPKKELIGRFFESYTVDKVLDVVQEEVKKNNGFRFKILQWIESKIGSWKAAEYVQKEKELCKKIEEEVEKELDVENEYLVAFEEIMQLINLLSQEGTSLQKEESWDGYLQQVLGLDRSKLLIGESKRRKEIIKKLCTASIGEDLAKKIFEKITSNSSAEFTGEFTLLKKAKLIVYACQRQEIGPLEIEVAKRMITKETKPIEVIKGLLEKARQAEFLEYFDVENLHEKGLTKELLEWLLIEQNIFQPLQS